MPSAGCLFIRTAILLLVSAAAVRATHAASPLIAAEAEKRAYLLLDAHYLDEVRRRLAKGDAQLEAALASLEQDAQKALAVKPPSVMDKTVTPPSGNKHDYMSQALYWWPNPDQPDGRPYIRRDGERNPELRKISDRANLGFVLSAVPTLALAFHLTGQSEYAAHAARLLQVWFLDTNTRMSPHLRFGQGIPGITEGRGIGIIETRELPEMLDGVRLLAGSPAWTKADQQGLEAWMRAYLEWLRESPHGQAESRNGNNHETLQITPFDADTLGDLLRRAADVWSEPTYARLAQQVGRAGDRLNLTTP
jgi:hypothetical protein